MNYCDSCRASKQIQKRLHRVYQKNAYRRKVGKKEHAIDKFIKDMVKYTYGT